ncbi:hypothetical protein QR680_017991 [Steinernema hermaphroditum]|uniref:Saposin B-type domain-containing protein n=1 Tax=Steinernema hermaphroditum TaxID=289476 RepID=A0AA39HIM9_9BILA|nr:hypothetical protein QR680_017991 [Steinernema hermaphroditum]
MKLLFALFLVASLVAVNEAGFECFICKLVVSAVEKKLTSDEGQINNNGDKLCDEITHNNPVLDPICQQIVDQSIDDIIDGLKNGQTTDQICQKIKMCTAADGN